MSIAIESEPIDIAEQGSRANEDRTGIEDSGEEKSPGRTWQSLFKYAGSLVDQSLVSGSRFLTSILIGSFCGAAELGTYALGFSILMGFHCLQLSLISRPYTIYGSQVEGLEKRELAGSILGQYFIFGLLATLSLLAVAGTQYWMGWQSTLTPVLLVLAVGTPFILFREHARQFCFAHLNVGNATLVDFISTAIHIGGIGWLALQGQLSAVSAIGVTAIASGVSGFVWLCLDRHEIRVVASRILPDFRRQWVIGRWDCASEITFTSQIYGLTWLLALMLDNATVGIYAACMMSIQVLNPFLLGINSVLVPKTAREFSAGGVNALNSFVQRTTYLVGGATLLFASITAIWGPGVLEFLYRGQGFTIPVFVVAMLAFGVVVEVVGIGPENGLWAMERHDFNFRVEVAGAAATLVSALVLISSFGLAGAAMSYFFGRLVTTLAHWIAYRVAVTRIATPSVE